MNFQPSLIDVEDQGPDVGNIQIAVGHTCGLEIFGPRFGPKMGVGQLVSTAHSKSPGRESLFLLFLLRRPMLLNKFVYMDEYEYQCFLYIIILLFCR